MPLFFLFNLFLEARAEILEKIAVFFGRFEDTKSTFWNYLTFKMAFKASLLKIDWLICKAISVQKLSFYFIAIREIQKHI